MKRLCLLLLLSAITWAEPDGRKPIQDYYAGLSMAAELKFAEGMTSHRSSDYQSIDVDGRREDKLGERYRYRDLFQNSLSVRLAVRLLKFSQRGPTCHCLVEQRWEITRALDKPPKTRVSQERRTLEDTWTWKQGQWRLARSITTNAELPRWP